MVIYKEFLYISVPGIILSIKPKTIAYMTQLTSVNTCVLHHGYIQNFCIFQFQVKFLSIKPKTIAYITHLTSLNTCALHHGYINSISVYLSSRYNSKYQTKNCCIYDPVNVSKYMCITPWFYIQNFCIFQFQV